MKRHKRTLALLLCAVLCFNALPVSAFAAEAWPDVDDSIYDFFTAGSPGSAEGSGKLPTLFGGSDDRVTWRVSDDVLVIGGTGEAIMPYAESRVDSPGTLFKRNPYIETAIIQEGTTSTRCLFKFMPNLKNIIVMSDETDVNGIACDCPQMNTIIVGADRKDSSLAMGYNEFDSINKTTNNYTGGGLAISYPDPVDNMVVLSSSCGDFQKQFSEAKTLIADMNLPQFALDLLPANLGGGSASVELPEQAPVTVSPWAESIVDEAEAQKLFPYRIYDVYGRDFRSLFPANH